MRRHSLPIGIFAIVCGLLAPAAPARAAATQTWVSGTGTNAGSTCPMTAPCRTFQYAHDQTAAGGAINVLSPGSFGPVAITKSISIVADGVEAAIHTGAGGAAITVNAAGIIVFLRGLTIDVTGVTGISLMSGAALHVHNSVVRRASFGIRLSPSSGTSELYVADSVFANNSGSGISVQPTGSGGARAMLDRVRVENAGAAGIFFRGDVTTGTITATVRDSVSAGNSSNGIVGLATGGGTTNVMIDRTAVVNNNGGIEANGFGATIRIGDSTVSGNQALALSIISSGKIESYKTNKVHGNSNDGVTPAPIVMK